MRELIQDGFTTAGRTLRAFVQADDNFGRIEAVARTLAACFQAGGKVIVFGNGGSLCDATHFAEELTGRYRQDRPALPAIALNDPAHISCVANDYGFEYIFSRGVEALTRPGDVAVGLSTSGNSSNVIAALKTARDRGCRTVAILGGEGGLLAGTCDFELLVPADTSDRVQELHIIILHILVHCVEILLFGESEEGS